MIPPLPDGESEPSKALIASVSGMSAILRPKVDVLVGMSAMGLQAERALLDEIDGLDLLFGGGDGKGFIVRYGFLGDTPWIRSYTEGKTVAVVTFRKLPHTDGFDPRTDVAVEIKALTDKVAEDPAMASLFDFK